MQSEPWELGKGGFGSVDMARIGNQLFATKGQTGTQKEFLAGALSELEERMLEFQTSEEGASHSPEALNNMYSLYSEVKDLWKNNQAREHAALQKVSQIKSDYLPDIVTSEMTWHLNTQVLRLLEY